VAKTNSDNSETLVLFFVICGPKCIRLSQYEGDIEVYMPLSAWWHIIGLWRYSRQSHCQTRKPCYHKGDCAMHHMSLYGCCGQCQKSLASGYARGYFPEIVNGAIVMDCMKVRTKLEVGSFSHFW